MRDGGYSAEFFSPHSEPLPETLPLLEKEPDSDAAYVDFVFEKKVNEAKHLNEINQREHAMYKQLAPAVHELQEQIKMHETNPDPKFTDYLLRAFGRLANQFPLPRETRETFARFGTYLRHGRYELIQGSLQNLLDYQKTIASHQREIQPPLEAAVEVEILEHQPQPNYFEIRQKKKAIARDFNFPFDVSMYSPSMARTTLEVRENYLRRLHQQPQDFITRYEIERVETEIAVLKKHLATVNSDSGVRFKKNEVGPQKGGTLPGVARGPFHLHDTDIAPPYSFH